MTNQNPIVEQPTSINEIWANGVESLAQPIVIFCALLLIFHISLRYFGGNGKEGLDWIAFGLILVGLSPFISPMLDTTKIGNIEFKFRQINREFSQQSNQINTLTFLISHFLSKDEFTILKRLSEEEYYEIDVHIFPDEFKSDIRHLRGLGFINNFENKGVRAMYEPKSSSKRNVREYFFVTESGRQFMTLREVPAQTKA